MWKKKASESKDALFSRNTKKGSGGSSQSRPAPATRSRGYSSKTVSTTQELSESARKAKRDEAHNFKTKANNCMQQGLFKSPDPVAASTFFKRAADCYHQTGDLKSEYLYRVESAKCNVMVRAWTSAASDYESAAKIRAGNGSELSDQYRQDASTCFLEAASAWIEVNEREKAAKCHVDSALVLLDKGVRIIPRQVLGGLEAAVEAHIPDVINPFARYRQTGCSIFLEEGDTIESVSLEDKALAEAHVVKRAYSYEPLLNVSALLTQHGEFASALYAVGAITTILERDGISTLTLSRSYCSETILLLAAGDPVAAEQRFLQKHIQSTPYISSRECKLAEELFRALKEMDSDALEAARDPSGTNRAALANLDTAFRVVVSELRPDGIAQRNLHSGKREPEAAISQDSQDLAKRETNTYKTVDDSLAQEIGALGVDESSSESDDEFDLR